MENIEPMLLIPVLRMAFKEDRCIIHKMCSVNRTMSKRIATLANAIMQDVTDEKDRLRRDLLLFLTGKPEYSPRRSFGLQFCMYRSMVITSLYPMTNPAPYESNTFGLISQDEVFVSQGEDGERRV
jgi:hypothetical protein